MLWLLLLGMGRRGMGRGTREFSGDENVVYLDRGSDDAKLCVCRNSSNYTIKNKYGLIKKWPQK